MKPNYQTKKCEEVRFLLNFKMDAQSPMALILVGQSELWENYTPPSVNE